jgi:outer membrane lipase/esterase
VHPTPRSQEILADYVQSLIDGPAQYSLLPETALRTRAAHVRTLAEGGRAARAKDVGTIGAFASYDGGDFDVDAAQGLASQATTLNTFTIGVVGRVSDGVSVGAAVGKSKGKARWGDGAGGYRADELTWSVFGGFRTDNFYALAAASIGEVDFNDTRRNIQLGQVTRIAESRPQGNNASVFASLGYDFNVGGLTIGPVVNLASQNVDVNQFDESPSGTTSLTGMLTVAPQKRKSEVWSAGARASYDLGGWTPWIRVTADKERKDDVRFVGATVRSLGSVGTVYDIPAYASDSSFITTSLGITGKLTEWISVGAAFTKISGRSGIKEDGATATIAVRF